MPQQGMSPSYIPPSNNMPQQGMPPPAPSSQIPPPYIPDPNLVAMSNRTSESAFFSKEDQEKIFGPPPDYNSLFTAAPASALAPQAPLLQAPGGAQSPNIAQGGTLPPILQFQVDDQMRARALSLMPGGHLFAPVYQPVYNTVVENKGFVTHDDNLNRDVNALAGYFSRFNQPPEFQVRVTGFHMETRTRTVSDGNGGSRTETYEEKVIDFLYSVDASRFLWPIGFMQVLPDKNTGRARTLFEVLSEYANSGNLLKNITMYKDIRWNFLYLHQMITSQIRALGWGRGLDVEFPMQHNQVVARSNSALANMWSNKCVRCLCIFPFFIPIGCLWFTCLCCYAKNFDDSLRSHFSPWCTEEQFFMMHRALFIPFGVGNCPVQKGDDAAFGGEGCCHRSCPSLCNCPFDC